MKSVILAAITLIGSASSVADNGPRRPESAGLAHSVRGSMRHVPPLDSGDATGRRPAAAALSQTPSALCQALIGKLHTYRRPRPDVDVINGDTFILSGPEAGCNGAQNETTIAVNPLNPRNLVAGANDYRIFNTRTGRNDASGYAYASFDAGRTWIDVQLPHLTFQTGATGPLADMDAAGDPSVAFGPDGTVYFSLVAFSRLNLGGAIVVSASHDGGRTWGEPSIVDLEGVDALGNPIDTTVFPDKDWVTVDPSSGAVYVTWIGAHLTDSPINVSRSDDGGVTWTSPSVVNPASSFTPNGVTPFSGGPIPQVNRRGDLFIAYAALICETLACDQPTDHDAIVIAISHDHGATFTSSEIAHTVDFPQNADLGTFPPFGALTGENFTVNNRPQMTKDPVTDALYLTWADNSNGTFDPVSGASVKTNGDVLVMSSGDGVHWSRPVRIGTAADEFFPAVAAFDNRIAISFYTRTYDSNGIGLDVAYVAGRADDLNDLAHKPIHRITTQTSNPQVQFVGRVAVTGRVLQGTFIGDYAAAVLGSDGVFHPCWTDFRGNPGVTSPNQEIYTRAIQIGGEAGDEAAEEHGE